MGDELGEPHGLATTTRVTPRVTTRQVDVSGRHQLLPEKLLRKESTEAMELEESQLRGGGGGEKFFLNMQAGRCMAHRN